MDRPNATLEQLQILNRQRSSTMTSIDTLNIHPLETRRDDSDHLVRRNRSATTTTYVENQSFLKSHLHHILAPDPKNTNSPTWLLSDILTGLAGRDLDEYFIVTKGNDLVLLFQQHPELRQDIVLKNFINKIQFMFYHPVSEVRSTGYRIVRYIIHNYESLVTIIHSKILIFIIITMSTTRSSMGEKEQALKLIREFLRIDKGADNLSIGVLKSLVSIIECDSGESDPNTNHDIPQAFKDICIETICEIALLKPELVFHSGGFKVLINTIINDGSAEIACDCLIIVLKVLDNKSSRKFLRNGYDLVSMISIFTNIDEDTNKKLLNSKLQRAAFLFTILFKNFNGIMLLSIQNFKILGDLILCLKKKHPKLRDYILDIIFDVLVIKPLPWLASSPIGDIVRRINRLFGASSYSFQYSTLDPSQFEYNLINHMKGLIAFIFIKNNIFEHLLAIIDENSNESNVKKATLLSSHLYSISTNLIPSELLNISIPTSLYSLFELERVTRQINPTQKQVNLKSQIKSMTTKSRYNMDDLEFKALITNTKVLTIKEFEEWNWNLLLLTIVGPLANPKRFNEVLERSPKFFKRLMSFYRPFKFRFCNISIQTKASNKYIQVGCQLLELFLSLDVGVKYLMLNKLLPQLAEIIAQIDPYSGILARDQVLAPKLLENTVRKGYLRFIGVLSSSSEGLKILEHWQFFNLIHNIVENSAGSDRNNIFILEILKHADLSLDSQFRIIVSKCMKISNPKIKNYIINTLLPKAIKIKECEYFVVKILVNNLYETDDIVEKSIDLLNSYYSEQNFKGIEYLINLNPAIYTLARFVKGKKLLFNFLRISKGFKYLEDYGFVEQEFNKWTDRSNFSYLFQIESLIQIQLFPYFNNTKFTDEDYHSINFFKYLLSTEEGLNYFTNYKQRHFLDLLINEVNFIANRIRDEDGFLDSDNQSDHLILLLNTLKQNLWILGNMAMGTYGVQLIDPSYNMTLEKSVINIVFDLFKTCPIWQVRGLCFFLIGMFSATIEGIEILDELDWTTAVDQYSVSKCVAYPKQDIASIFDVEITNPYRDVKYYSIFNGNGTIGTGSSIMWDLTSSDDDEFQEIDGDEHVIQEKIISLIQLLNSVLNRIERKSIKELTKLKKNSPQLFENINLFLEIIKIVDKGNFKFGKRKFLFDLFIDTKVLEVLIRRERKRN